MWRKEDPFVLLVGIQIGEAIVENSMEIAQKIKNGSTFWPSDPTSGEISEGTENTHLKAYRHPLFIGALFTVTTVWKQPKGPSIDECIKQLWDSYTMEYYSAIKKKILPFAAVWMELENIMLSEISHSEKDEYHMISLICGI